MAWLVIIPRRVVTWDEHGNRDHVQLVSLRANYGAVGLYGYVAVRMLSAAPWGREQYQGIYSTLILLRRSLSWVLQGQLGRGWNRVRSVWRRRSAPRAASRLVIIQGPRDGIQRENRQAPRSDSFVADKNWGASARRQHSATSTASSQHNSVPTVDTMLSSRSICRTALRSAFQKQSW